MSYFERGSEHLPIPAGESVLTLEGGRATVGDRVAGGAIHATLEARPDGQVVIRKAVDVDVFINNVRLGGEPTPLLHGDKVAIAGAGELTFVDERRSGSTVYLEAVTSLPGAAGGAEPVTPGTESPLAWGRLVCLTDGREYEITAPALVFGRDAASDVVVAGKDVSRRHAEIVESPRGYLVVDSSTNGTFVNGERVRGQRMLERGDIIRIGADEFRFSAEGAAAAEPVSAALRPLAGAPADEAEPAAGPPAAAAPPPPEPSAAAAPPLPELPAMRPGALPARERSRGESGSAGRPLASLLVRSGPAKGTRFEVLAPVANLGRADYNDVVLADASVSAHHAKLQRREGIWVLADLGSTNGSYVDDERVEGEAPLGPGAALRLGEVTLVFEPTDDALGLGTGAPATSLMNARALEVELARVHREVAAAREPAGGLRGAAPGRGEAVEAPEPRAPAMPGPPHPPASSRHPVPPGRARAPRPPAPERSPTGMLALAAVIVLVVVLIILTLVG